MFKVIHNKRGFKQQWLSITFSKAIFLGNGLVAILAGLFGNLLVGSLAIGLVAPFDATSIFLAIGMAITMSSWTENYGDSSERKDLMTQFRGVVVAIASDVDIPHIFLTRYDHCCMALRGGNWKKGGISSANTFGGSSGFGLTFDVDSFLSKSKGCPATSVATPAKGMGMKPGKSQRNSKLIYQFLVLTHHVRSMCMLSLIYSEILKMLRMWGLVNFDVEISSPNDSYGSPRGYLKQRSTESDHQHIMTTKSLLLKILRDLKQAFWPFLVDQSQSPFLRAAKATSCSDRSAYIEKMSLLTPVTLS